jgi:hypothetical protein
MANEGFNLNRLYSDSKKALFQPKDYFSSLPVEGGIGEPIIKALVYGVVAGFFVLLWSLFNVTGYTGGMFGGMVGIGGFFWSIIAAVIGVFIGGLIILIVSAICGGNTDFEPNVRVAAAIMVLFPINAFLGFFDGISHTLGSIITLLVNLYGVYMLYLAVTGVLRAKEQTTRIVSYVLAGLMVLFLIIGLATRSAVERATGLNEKRIQEMIEKQQKELEDIEEELEDEN